jgi:hypothetical protein
METCFRVEVHKYTGVLRQVNGVLEFPPPRGPALL